MTTQCRTDSNWTETETCDGEKGRICSDCSFCGVTQDSVLVFDTRLQSLPTDAAGLAVDTSTELFRCTITEDFFTLVRGFRRRRRRIHGVFLVCWDFIVIDVHFGVRFGAAGTRSLSVTDEQGSNAPNGLSPSWKPTPTIIYFFSSIYQNHQFLIHLPLIICKRT